MKSFKLWSLVLMSTLVFGLTSCLNSDDDGTQYGGGIVRVEYSLGTTYFVTTTGTKLMPTSTSLADVQKNYKFTATSGLAYIVYTTTSTDTSSSSTGTLTVTLSYASSIQGSSVLTTEGATNDSIATRPIISLDQLSTSASDKILLYDNNTIMVATNYYFSKVGHTFTLVFYPEKVKSGDTTMTVYLRHRSTDTGSNYTSYNYATNAPYLYYHSFDIRSMLAQFANKAGNAPTEITLLTNVNDVSGQELAKELTDFTIKYKTTE